MSTELCGCPTCLATRAASTIPVPRDLGSAIRESRDETSHARQLRLTKTLTPQPASTTKSGATK